jgi:hypothetical protein
VCSANRQETVMENEPRNGKPNGAAQLPPDPARDPFGWAKATTTPSGRIHADEPATTVKVEAAVGQAGVHEEAFIDREDPADASLLALLEWIVQRVKDATQRMEHDLAALRSAEGDRDAVGPAPVKPATPLLLIAILVLASGLVTTITFHAGFGLPAFPTNPAKAMLFGLVFGLAVTAALVVAPFKAATYEQRVGLWRWGPFVAGTAGLGAALYLIRDAQTASGHSVSVGLALMEGIIVLVAECVAHVYAQAWDEYRTLSKAFAKAEAFVESARRHAEESRQALADAEAKRDGLQAEIAGRQSRARRAQRAMACAGHAAAEGVTAAVEDARGRVFGNTWKKPTEADALERLVGKKK